MEALDYNSLLLGLSVAVPVIGFILKLLGSLVVLGQSLVGILPSKSAEEKWEKINSIPVINKILVALMSFAVIQKK